MMRLARRLFWFGALGLVGVSTTAPRAHAQFAQQDPQAQPTVLIRIADAYIAPTKANGAPWDGLGKVDDGVVQGVHALLVLAGAPDITAQLGVQFAQLVNTGTQPPDVYGRARLLLDGAPYRCQDGTADCTTVSMWKIQDDYMPVWNPMPSLPRVPFNSHLSLEVYLVDADLQYDDPIGTAVLGWQEIQMAKANGGRVTHIRIDQQTHGQAIYVGLSVF